MCRKAGFHIKTGNYETLNTSFKRFFPQIRRWKCPFWSWSWILIRVDSIIIALRRLMDIVVIRLKFCWSANWARRVRELLSPAVCGALSVFIRGNHALFLNNWAPSALLKPQRYSHAAQLYFLRKNRKNTLHKHVSTAIQFHLNKAVLVPF